MILYGPIQERALDEAQRQIKPVVAVNSHRLPVIDT